MSDTWHRLAEHVTLFNEAVRTGDYTDFVATFHEDAVMRFAGVPVGPLHGRAEIAKGYADQPPTDTMALCRADLRGGPAGDTVTARFTWSAGGDGWMRITWRDGMIGELLVSFLPPDLGNAVWWDLRTPDLAAAERFYGELFGWEFRRGIGGENQDRWSVVVRDGTDIGLLSRQAFPGGRGGLSLHGAAERSGRPQQTGAVLYLEVADLRGTVAQAQRLGAELLAGPSAIGGEANGAYADLRDPTGVVFGLWAPGSRRVSSRSGGGGRAEPARGRRRPGS